MAGNLGWTGSSSRRPDCHFADALSPSLLKHLPKVEGCSRITVSPTARLVTHPWLVQQLQQQSAAGGGDDLQSGRGVLQKERHRGTALMTAAEAAAGGVAGGTFPQHAYREALSKYAFYS